MNPDLAKNVAASLRNVGEEIEDFRAGMLPELTEPEAAYFGRKMGEMLEAVSHLVSSLEEGCLTIRPRIAEGNEPDLWWVPEDEKLAKRIADALHAISDPIQQLAADVLPELPEPEAAVFKKKLGDILFVGGVVLIPMWQAYPATRPPAARG
jgi:hypothetical protein